MALRLILAFTALISSANASDTLHVITGLVPVIPIL
jgi:hypothetical protein